MSGSRNDQFYFRLPANHIALGELLMEDHLFYDVPESWHVVITDIQNSTGAVGEGMHETVNLIATGSIVTVLNIAFKAGITVPFFFGGDGGTFIIPDSIVTKVMQGLHRYQQNTRENFGLELRIGAMPVANVYREGYSLKVSKLRVSERFSIPVVLGEGLYFAEKKIKGGQAGIAYESDPDHELDLSGMQCRWDKIEPPGSDQEVVTLLVMAEQGHRQSERFAGVMQLIEEIYGPLAKRQPISVPRLIWKSTFKKVEIEMLAKKGKANLLGVFASWFGSLFGYVYFRTSHGKNYLNTLVEMSDTLVMDGKINTVITGTARQRAMLQEALDAMEQKGQILYGLHVSKESVMSCYVRDLKDGHVHFVDGAEGGYTKAAGVLKQKLKRLNS